jgi:hypothetical protein
MSDISPSPVLFGRSTDRIRIAPAKLPGFEIQN